MAELGHPAAGVSLALATLGLFAAAGPAAALVPPLPTCSFYEETGPETTLGDYEPTEVGNGFVSFVTTTRASDGADLVFVLEYCPYRQQLVATVADFAANRQVEEAVDGLWRAMIFGSAEYTMEQIRDALRVVGAEARIRQIGYQSCACATVGP